MTDTISTFGGGTYKTSYGRILTLGHFEVREDECGWGVWFIAGTAEPGLPAAMVINRSSTRDKAIAFAKRQAHAQ